MSTNKKQRPEPTFEDLEAAFPDRVRLSLYEPPPPRPWPFLTETSNRPSGGPSSRYGRLSQGECEITGNRFEMNYSLFTRLPHMPKALLYLNSEQAPVTVAEIYLAVRSLTRKRFSVSYAEVTWDLRITFDEVAQRIISRVARRRLLLVDPKTGRRTLYLGARNSERQVCVYDKPGGVVRIEVRLRKRGLKRLGITRPEQLLLLRQVDFTRLFSICKFRIPATIIKKKWQRKSWAYLAEHDSMESVLKIFKQLYPVPPAKVLARTPLDKRLRNMQRRMVL